MRNWTKTKVEAAWKDKEGNVLAQARVGKRGGVYMIFMLETSYAPFPGAQPILTREARDFRDMTKNQISDACRRIGTLLLTKGSANDGLQDRLRDPHPRRA